MHQQQQRKVADARDDAEVAQRIIGQIFVDRRIDRERTGRGAGDGVAIVGCGHHGLQPGDAIGTGAVVDDDLLADALAEFLRDDARHEIDTTTRREWHDHADRFVGVGLCRGDGGAECGDRAGCGAEQGFDLHDGVLITKCGECCLVGACCQSSGDGACYFVGIFMSRRLNIPRTDAGCIGEP